MFLWRSTVRLTEHCMLGNVVSSKEIWCGWLQAGLLNKKEKRGKRSIFYKLFSPLWEMKLSRWWTKFMLLDNFHPKFSIQVLYLHLSLLSYATDLKLHRRGSRGGEMGEFSPPFFWAPLQSCWRTDLKHLNQALVLLHCYKNSPPISKSWIRTCYN